MQPPSASQPFTVVVARGMSSSASSSSSLLSDVESASTHTLHRRLVVPLEFKLSWLFNEHEAPSCLRSYTRAKKNDYRRYMVAMLVEESRRIAPRVVRGADDVDERFHAVADEIYALMAQWRSGAGTNDGVVTSVCRGTLARCPCTCGARAQSTTSSAFAPYKGLVEKHLFGGALTVYAVACCYCGECIGSNIGNYVLRRDAEFYLVHNGADDAEAILDLVTPVVDPLYKLLCPNTPTPHLLHAAWASAIASSAADNVTVVDESGERTKVIPRLLLHLSPYFEAATRFTAASSSSSSSAPDTRQRIVLVADGFDFDDFALVWDVKVTALVGALAADDEAACRARVFELMAQRGEAFVNVVNFLGLLW